MATPAAATPIQAVQCFGRKKTAVAVAYCKKGKGILKLNGSPIEMVQPELLRYKVFEPVLLLGPERFAQVDIRIRCKGGGYTSQIYAIRQVRAQAARAHVRPPQPRMSTLEHGIGARALTRNPSQCVVRPFGRVRFPRTGYRKEPCGVLSEVRGRGVQEGDPRYPYLL